MSGWNATAIAMMRRNEPDRSQAVGRDNIVTITGAVAISKLDLFFLGRTISISKSQLDSATELSNSRFAAHKIFAI